jgi:hypothetical protein
MNNDKMTQHHTVVCYHCGRQVTDLTRTKAEIRKQLHNEKGWFVAIPAWAAGVGRRSNRKTVDCCDACASKAAREGVDRLALRAGQAAVCPLTSEKLQ